MLLVIIGAGASRDSAPDYSNQDSPPLTSELFRRFDNLLPKYQGSAAALWRVEQGVAKGGSVEGELQKLRDLSNAGYEPMKRQLLALQFVFQEGFQRISETWGSFRAGRNNFASLVAALEEWRTGVKSRVLYVTFNYDTLLEQAISNELSYAFEAPSKYLSDGRAVVKVHGSCNWRREVDSDPALDIPNVHFQDVINAAAQLTVTNNFHVVATPEQVLMGQRVLAPALSIPVLNKNNAEEFSCPPEHLSRMRDWLHDVTDVLAIGWQGAEAHFLKELNEHLPHAAKLTVVRSPGRQVAADLQPGQSTEPVACDDLSNGWPTVAGLDGDCSVLHTGFTYFVREHLASFVEDLRLRA